MVSERDAAAARAGTLAKQLLEGYFTEDEFKDSLAPFYGGKRPGDRTLRRWHQRRIGPPRIRIGRVVMYKAELVRDWLDRHLKGAEPRAPRGRRGRRAA